VPNRVLWLRDNDRVVARGLSERPLGRWTLTLDANEIDTIRLYATAWLDNGVAAPPGETIASATATGSVTPVLTLGPAPVMMVDIQVPGQTGTGDFEVLITTSAGRKKIVRFGVAASGQGMIDCYRSDCAL
jgi:hypothetical protein